jgi:hypothetical protein
MADMIETFNHFQLKILQLSSWPCYEAIASFIVFRNEWKTRVWCIQAGSSLP